MTSMPRLAAAVGAGLLCIAAGWWIGRSTAVSGDPGVHAPIGTAPAAAPASAADAAQATGTGADSAEPAPAYALPNTHVHAVPDARAGRAYEVWVDLPPSYVENDRPYPVVFTTDADVGFPLIRSLRRRIGAKGQNIEDFVLVGLSFAVGEESMPSKRRDYTPTDPFARPSPPANTRAYRRGDTYGQAAAYRDYIERDVFPLIASRYRVDMTRSVYVGHSLGGLFGSYVLLTRPEMFRHYVLGSPSLWFDRRTIFDIEADYARAHRDLQADVQLYIGEYETFGDGPRHMKTVDMVGDTHRFAATLRQRRYPGLRVHAETLPDEDHLTILPRMIVRGLQRALPGHGPYTGA